MRKLAISFLAAFFLVWCEKAPFAPPTPLPSGAGEEYGVATFLEVSCCVNDAACQDGLWCNGRELCDCWGECIPGLPPDCDDEDPCTRDRCDEVQDRCVHERIPGCCEVDAHCNDNNECTTEVCHRGTCRYTNLPDGTPCGDVSAVCRRNRCRGGVCDTSINEGGACPYLRDECFNPGICGRDGLCHPGLRNAPPNDQCPGMSIPLDATGHGSVSGSTTCAGDEYSSICGGVATPDVVYSITIEVPRNVYQLHAYNIVLDGNVLLATGYNPVLYLRRVCADANTTIACNDDCIATGLFNCGGIGPTDSALSLGPRPVGTMETMYIFVDGKGGLRGDYVLSVNRVELRNNPCSSWRDNVRVVDATAGGEYRGNINGYVNDMMDNAFNWVKTRCHDGAEVAGFDWPARAWFKLAPAADTRYRISMDERTPANWFDAVVEVWDNSRVRGCDGTKERPRCAHLAGRNDAVFIDGLVVRAGETYLVGVSSHRRPVGGDYIIRFEIR